MKLQNQLRLYSVTLSLSAVFFEIAPSAFEQDLEVQGR